MRPHTIGVAQSGPGGIDLDWLSERLAPEPVDLVILPELANDAYFPLEERTPRAAAAEPLDGPFISRVGAIAQQTGTYILAGVHLAQDGSAWNAAVLLGPDGTVVPGRDLEGRERLAYRKTHLCNITTQSADFREAEYFAVGGEHVVWETPLGRLGCLICYDRHFPEAWRVLRRAGVDIVGVPVASPVTSRDWFVAEMQAMAMQQVVYAAVANRAGAERLAVSGTTTAYGGLSCIVAPNGSVSAAAAFGEPNCLVRASIEAELLARIRRENRFFEDIRTDLYERETAATKPAERSRS